MNYKIFNSYEEFLLREDKKENGISENFYKLHKTIFDIHGDNLEHNEGCWNCLNCVECKNCVFCINCQLCDDCRHCNECFNIQKEGHIYCLRKKIRKNKKK